MGTRYKFPQSIMKGYTMELFKASAQWSNRPADERFESLTDLYNQTKHYAESAREKIMPFDSLRVEALDGDVQLVGKLGIPAKLTHWAFGQLCQKLSAPASYLRDLPATLACQNLNHGLAKRIQEAQGAAGANLLFHSNGSLLLRAITTDKYSRIWNYEVAERLLGLEANGWNPARPDKRFDGGDPTLCQVCNGGGRAQDPNVNHAALSSCQYCKGTGKALPALYASDHDMFVFLANRNVTVTESGSDGAVYRGVIVENSEVGASALKLTRFLYREMCGNHIIWGASDVVDLSVRHVGDARNRWGYFMAAVRKYSNESASDMEAKISASKSRMIGGTKEEVLDALFGKRSLNIPRKTLEAGYDACLPSQDGSPRSVWGMVQGLTRHSQTLAYADARTDLDRKAGKILEAEF